MVSVATVLLSNDGLTKITYSVIAEMVHKFICDHDVQLLMMKRHSSNANYPHPPKKRTQIKYDREHAKKCVMDDWLGPIPSQEMKFLQKISPSLAMAMKLHVSIVGTTVLL